MTDKPEPRDIHEAIRAFQAAQEQFARVTHFNDPVFMKRDMTESERKTFNERRNAETRALKKVCGFPCENHQHLRAKAKFLTQHLQKDHLEQHQMRAVLESILQMPK